MNEVCHFSKMGVVEACVVTAQRSLPAVHEPSGVAEREVDLVASLAARRLAQRTASVTLWRANRALSVRCSLPMAALTASRAVSASRGPPAALVAKAGSDR